MNQKTKFIMLLAVCILASVSLFAQLTRVRKENSRPRLPAWVSDKGYWVVESNLRNPQKHIVFFYSNDNVLMYKETLEGIKLNTEKRSVKMKLKRALETSAIAWQNSKGGPTANNADSSLVMTVLR